MAEHRYLIALGSNQRHPRHGEPEQVLSAAFADLDREGLALDATSPIRGSAPIGPSRRRYANAAAIIRTRLDPPGLLAHLKAIERRFGRRPGGQRWRARVLDLDIILWSGGTFTARTLTVPHAAFRQRDFVLAPARAIAGTWRDPKTGLTIRHLAHRLRRAS